MHGTLDRQPRLQELNNGRTFRCRSAHHAVIMPSSTYMMWFMFEATCIHAVYILYTCVCVYVYIVAVSGCLFRLPSGVKPAVGGMVLGTLLRSAP